MINGEPIATYEYTDEHGEVFYRIARFEPKDFRPQHLSPDGEWVNGYGEFPRVLYNLSAFREATEVFFVEGEKDVETLRDQGFTATTNPGGAGGWKEEYASEFYRKDVYIIPDNDLPGRHLALRVARAIKNQANSIKILLLEGVKDITEWFEAGHSEVELSHLIDKTNNAVDIGNLSDAELEHVLLDGFDAPRLRTGPTRFLRISDLPSLAEDMEQTESIQFVVDGLIARSAITMFSGAPGSGKSTLCTAIAAAVARGELFAGMPTRQAPVLYLDRENSKPVVKERLRRICDSYPPNVRYWGRWMPNEPPDIGDSRIVEWVSECAPKPLVIIDSLVAFHAGDENAAIQTRDFFQTEAGKLTKEGAAVVFIHHTGKSQGSQEYRGSSDIKAAIDVGYTVKNSGEFELTQLTLETFKVRFTVENRLVLGYEDGRFVRKGSVGEFIAYRKELLALVRDNPGICKGQLETLAQAQWIARKQVRDFLKLEEGKALRVESIKPRGTAYYVKEDLYLKENPLAA